MSSADLCVDFTYYEMAALFVAVVVGLVIGYALGLIRGHNGKS